MKGLASKERELQQLKTNQHEKITAESAEEREARLQRTSTTNQCQQLATESAEQREARLQQLRINCPPFN